MINFVIQVMGGELKQILENQRKLEEQFEQLTSPDQLKEQAHSLNATAQGRMIIVLTTVCTLGVSLTGQPLLTQRVRERERESPVNEATSACPYGMHYIMKIHPYYIIG